MFMKDRTFVPLVVAVVSCAFTVLRAQTSPSTMKAIVVHEFGGPEVLRYEDTPKPVPKENEMLIRVIAAGVCVKEVASPQVPAPRKQAAGEYVAVLGAGMMVLGKAGTGSDVEQERRVTAVAVD